MWKRNGLICVCVCVREMTHCIRYVSDAGWLMLFYCYYFVLIISNRRPHCSIELIALQARNDSLIVVNRLHKYTHTQEPIDIRERVYTDVHTPPSNVYVSMPLVSAQNTFISLALEEHFTRSFRWHLFAWNLIQFIWNLLALQNKTKQNYKSKCKQIKSH